MLVFTPTWIGPDGKEAMRPECRASIEAQVIDRPWVWVVGVDNPYPIGDHRNVLHQYQQARELFLKGGQEGGHEASPYDMLITIEHDQMLPDTDALQRLIDTPGDVIYAPYLLRHDIKKINLYRRHGWRDLGESLSVYPDELAEARTVPIWPVSGAGFGCTLFRRAVLEAISFEASDAANFCPDMGFARAALHQRFESVGRMDVPVAHRWLGSWWDPWGGRLTAPDTSDLIDGQWQMDRWLDREQWLCAICKWDTLRGLKAAREHASNCPRCHPPQPVEETKPPSPIAVADKWGRPLT